MVRLVNINQPYVFSGWHQIVVYVAPSFQNYRWCLICGFLLCSNALLISLKMNYSKIPITVWQFGRQSINCCLWLYLPVEWPALKDDHLSHPTLVEMLEDTGRLYLSLGWDRNVVYILCSFQNWEMPGLGNLNWRQTTFQFTEDEELADVDNSVTVVAGTVKFLSLAICTRMGNSL